jgi:hypothetical protein
VKRYTNLSRKTPSLTSSDSKGSNRFALICPGLTERQRHLHVRDELEGNGAPARAIYTPLQSLAKHAKTSKNLRGAWEANIRLSAF